MLGKAAIDMLRVWSATRACLTIAFSNVVLQGTSRASVGVRMAVGLCVKEMESEVPFRTLQGAEDGGIARVWSSEGGGVKNIRPTASV